MPVTQRIHHEANHDHKSDEITISRIGRLSLCSGSGKYAGGIGGPEAKSGSRVHAGVDREDDGTLSDEERQKRGSIEWALRQIEAEHMSEGEWTVRYEARVSIYLPKLERMLTGHVDYVAERQDGRAPIVVVDFKSGRIAVTPASKNWQLITYMAAAAAANDPEAFGYITQPWATWGPKRTDTGAEPLPGKDGWETWIAEMESIVERALAPDPEFGPTETCSAFCCIRGISDIVCAGRTRGGIYFYSSLAPARWFSYYRQGH